MANTKILSVFLVSTLAACSNGGEKPKLAERSPEQRCLELEQRWDVAHQSLAQAEGRYEQPWLLSVADTFNPLTNNSDENLKMAKNQEQRARENYVAFGCMDLNKLKINSAYKTEAPKQPQIEEQKPLPQAQQMSVISPVSYQSYNQGYNQGYSPNPYMAPQGQLSANPSF